MIKNHTLKQQPYGVWTLSAVEISLQPHSSLKKCRTFFCNKKERNSLLYVICKCFFTFAEI